MPHCAPESGFVDPLDNQHGKQEPRNVNAADQTSDRGGRRHVRRDSGDGMRRHGTRRTPIPLQALQLPALAPLEQPGIGQGVAQNPSSKTPQAKSARWGPLQNPPEELFLDDQPHLTTVSLAM